MLLLSPLIRWLTIRIIILKVNSIFIFFSFWARVFFSLFFVARWCLFSLSFSLFHLFNENYTLQCQRYILSIRHVELVCVFVCFCVSFIVRFFLLLFLLYQSNIHIIWSWFLMMRNDSNRIKLNKIKREKNTQFTKSTQNQHTNRFHFYFILFFSSIQCIFTTIVVNNDVIHFEMLFI